MVRHPILRTVILLFAITSTGLVSIGAAMTFRLVRDLGQGPGAFGLTLSGLGVGTLVGALLASRLGPRTNVARILVGSVLAMGSRSSSPRPFRACPRSWG